MRLTSLAAAALCAAAASAADPLPKAPPGWTVELVLEQPKILHPSVCCFAPDGRLFVGEDPMDMGADSEKPTDRVLCVHPDGKITVFAEKLHAVYGLAYLDGKVYVHHCPKFSVFTDDNGVGKDRKDLIATTNPKPNTGFNDHIPANMRLGMDGWFYMSTGDKGIFGAVGTDGSKAEIYGGGVLRFRPDGSRLEVYSTGTRNHLDVAINAEDEIFTYDNTDDGHGWWTRVTHMVDGGFYGYPWDYKPQRPYTLWKMTDYGGGSPTGAIAYNEDALPAKYRGSVFLCEWGRKQFLRLTVERDGGSYKIAEREDFLTANGGEFRPVGVAVSPDGRSLYVTDWNFGGWKQNKPAGRLIKVTYTGGKSEAKEKPTWYVPAAMGQKFDATVSDLVEGIKYPAQSVRLVAQRRLAEKGADAVEPLLGVLGDAKSPPFAKWSAIWTLDAIDGGKAGRDGILAALGDSDVSVVRQAARQLGGSRAKEAVPPLLKLLESKDGSVRFQAATALGRIGDAAAVAPLLRACEQTDLFARYAAFTALNRIGKADPAAWETIIAGFGDSAPAVREGAAFAVRETYEHKLAVALRDFAKSPKNAAEHRAAAIAALAANHRVPPAWNGKWWGTQPVKTAKPAGVVEYPGTAVVLGTVRDLLGDADPGIRKAAIEAVAITRDPTAAEKLVEIFQANADAEMRKAALRALAATKSPAAAELVAGLLDKPGDNATSLPEAVAAAAAIGGPKMLESLKQFASAEAPPDALVAAFEALAALKAKDAVPAVADRLQHPDAKVRAAAVAMLAGVGGDPAVAALVRLLASDKADTRRAAVGALGAIKSKSAVEPLLKAFADPETRTEAVSALAGTPDVRALDAYLDGLGSKSATLRDASRNAVTAVRADALPLIEARLDKAPALAPQVVAELQKVYSSATPITDWQVLGAFDIDAPDAVDPAAPKLDADYKDATGKAVKWAKAKVGKDGRVNLLGQGFGRGNNAAAFAHAVVSSPADRSVQLVAGSDDGLVVWVNGEKVFEKLGNRGYKADDFRIPVKLKAGPNALVAKVTQGSGPWEFSIAVPVAGSGKLFQTTVPKVGPEEFAAFATKTAGNADRGMALFRDLKGMACVKCHAATPGGPPPGDVGPSLLGVGAKYNKAQLVESVLYPSKQILDGYQQTKITTADGKSFAGVVRGETGDSVTLIDAEGRKHVLAKGDIDERKASPLSLMPDGLQTAISLQDFADLIAYLESLKEAPPKK